ncbi:hypothetical protein RB195_010749 [Necator americanus]|uniref:Uncharacterized protein n=1 Tax=Necator americanus TaxID=51031 RepID=A0ABR1CZE0_NECAM
MVQSGSAALRLRTQSPYRRGLPCEHRGPFDDGVIVSESFRGAYFENATNLQFRARISSLHHYGKDDTVVFDEATPRAQREDPTHWPPPEQGYRGQLLKTKDNNAKREIRVDTLDWSDDWIKGKSRLSCEDRELLSLRDT